MVTGSVTTAVLIGDTLPTARRLYPQRCVSPLACADDMPNRGVRGAGAVARPGASHGKLQPLPVTSTEDVDLVQAGAAPNFDSTAGRCPPESEYRDGLEVHTPLFRPLVGRAVTEAQFYARADTCAPGWAWSTRAWAACPSASRQCRQAPHQYRPGGGGGATQSTAKPQELDVTTPWLKIDDVFYEAAGRPGR